MGAHLELNGPGIGLHLGSFILAVLGCPAHKCATPKRGGTLPKHFRLLPVASGCRKWLKCLSGKGFRRLFSVCFRSEVWVNCRLLHKPVKLYQGSSLRRQRYVASERRSLLSISRKLPHVPLIFLFCHIA